MQRPTREWAAALILVLCASGATAQLQPPAPLAATVLPPVPNPGKNVASTLPSLTQKESLAPTVTHTVSSVKPQTLSSASPASSLLRAPLGTVGQTLTGVTSGQIISASPAGAVTLASPFNLALNRVATVDVISTPVGQAELASARALRLRALIHNHPTEIDSDDLGQPVIRGQLVLVDANEPSLRRLTGAGFRILADERNLALGLRMTTVQVPASDPTRQAYARLRSIAPQLIADYNHVFEPAGGALAPSKTSPARGGGASGPLIGMIDGGVAAHPSLAGRVVEQRDFTGALKATGHGTAVASLLIGKEGRFRGAAFGARLLVADVYGGRRSAGSASAIARAMGWLASKRPRVVNISLVGPQNELMRRAVAGLRARGIELVAAVGNDGPAAPPQYPASYPGVIAVTGVDARGVALSEAGNAAGLDFAAPGADMAAARPGKGYARVRGTSFAAPLAAGRLALLQSPQRLAAEAQPGKGRVGRGIVCFTCRIDPRRLRATSTLRR